MKIWDAVKQFYTKVGSILDCAALYVLASVLDIVSSLHFPPGFSESNPFSRHADGSFWLKHALITEGFNTVQLSFASAGCYIGARIFGSRVAKFAAGLPWLFYAWIHLDAAVQNFLTEIPGLYVSSMHDMLRRLLGY